jgi:hypothetical protein
LRKIHEEKSDSESKLTMSEFAEAIIYCLAPPPNRSLARPDNVKLVASWQSGLQTPSGLRQWKLRLQLMSPDMPLTRPKLGGLLHCWNSVRGVEKSRNRFTKINEIDT